MDAKQVRKTIREMIEKYDAYRCLWIAKYGTDKDFDAWFTKQVTGKPIGGVRC